MTAFIVRQHALPDTGFVRLPQFLGDLRATPPIPAIIPIGRSSWWAGVKSGKYPRGYKFGPRTTVWRVEDIRALIASVAEDSK